MKMHLLALAAAALLAACGGGDDSAAGTPMLTPAASADGLRRALSAVRVEAVTPEQAAEQLLNYAQVSPYASYFPGNPQTQTFGPFRFRYYPATGIYLGVVVTAGQGYTMNGVYVMGGAFGNDPVFQGLLTDFITPTDPNPPPTGANNGCYDLSLLEATGTRIVVNYQHSGTTSGTQTVDMVVNGPKTFEGRQAIESFVKTTGTLTVEGETGTTTLEAKNYAKRTGDAEVTEYGSDAVLTTTIAGFNVTMTTKSVSNPPFADKQYGLAVGQSITQSQTDTTTSTTSGIPGVPSTPQTTTTTTTTTTKFVGRESVTVPAKTYNTCKFETTTAGVPNVVTTMWVVDGKGVMVKMQTTENGVVSTKQEATSATLNGASL
ncbi:hypothetical protein [Aquabacterium humicola]|uniref:hypothetical protein n=1 Tax=Aquabacterium humicola TaxID=3237377 RepID=UPI002542FD16|nr:hypothetical protein [Rubrivivax pictus]